MRCHMVQIATADVSVIRLAATAAEAKTVRDELMEKFDVKKKDVTTEQHEVPLDKVGLLGYLNEVYTKQDEVEGEE